MADTGDDFLAALLRCGHETAPDAVGKAMCAALVALGCVAARLYFVDYDQASLRPVAASPAEEGSSALPVGTSLAGRAFLTREVQATEAEGGQHLWVPVSERADRIGVLELLVERAEHPGVTRAAEIGLVIGQYLHSVSRYTDAFQLLRRRQSMQLAADMQWDMLVPALNFETAAVSIAGVLEPAYDIGGDAFDYAAHDQVVDICILDAMGHGLNATLASALAIGAYRFGRRQGLALEELAGAVDRALVDQWDGERFVTGHLVRLDASAGILRWINAGHPSPFLVRAGRVVAEPACDPCLPLGLGVRVAEVGEVALEPGDRLVFYTDGAVEARDIGGEEIGVERLRTRVEAAMEEGRPAIQVLRRVVGDVMAHRGGQELADDVTVVLVQWHPKG